jgi:signal transduction histidine kinase/DNA-binding response OmpR family regulator
MRVLSPHSLSVIPTWPPRAASAAMRLLIRQPALVLVPLALCLLAIGAAYVLPSDPRPRIEDPVSVIAVTALLAMVMLLVIGYRRHINRSQAALQASEARYAEKSHLLEVTLDHISQGILMVDAELRLQVCNRRVTELFDLPPALRLTRPRAEDLMRTLWERGEFGRSEESFTSWFDRLVQSQLGRVVITEHCRPDGTIIEVHSNPLPGGGIVRTYTDITNRRHAEDALRTARDESAHAAQVKSEFLAMMSHEIRSPMNGLLGIIELLRDTKLDAEQEQMIALVHGSATSLMRVLNDVLNLAKLDAGAVDLTKEAVDLRGLVAELIAGMAPAIRGKALSLVGQVADDVTGSISTDPVRLRQILTNLLGNALKFTAEGSVRIDVGVRRLAAGPPVLSFAVSDTGIGIAPDVLGRLFEPFSQADASTTRLFGGTGLGLTISRRLARLLGGDIAVASTPGQGSVFTLTIPLDPVAASAARSDDERAISDDDLAGIRILLAEDQVTNRWLIRRQLERLGGSVTDVEDGAAALDEFDADRYDLIITDCHMPSIDGMELVRLIRAMEVRNGSRRLPILGLTADVTLAMRERCLRVGMDDIVTKPIDIRRLRAAIVGIMTQSDVGADMPERRLETDVFKPETYRELFADDLAAGNEWLETFLLSAAELAERIANAVGSSDRRQLAASAHQLAGAALSAGAMQLGAAARRLELAAQDATAPELDELRDAIIRSMEEARAAILGFMTAQVSVI